MSPGVTPRGFRIDLQGADLVAAIEAVKADFPTESNPNKRLELLRILIDVAIAERLDRLNVAVQGPRPPKGWVS